MARVKGGTVTHARHKKITTAAKGYYGRRKNTFKVAAQAVDKANQYLQWTKQLAGEVEFGPNLTNSD